MSVLKRRNQQSEYLYILKLSYVEGYESKTAILLNTDETTYPCDCQALCCIERS